MKTKFYKNTSRLVAAICSLVLLFSHQSHAQVTIYDQSFNAAYPSWPTGWSSSNDTLGWYMDTSSANQSYVPTAGEFGYPGASGGAMVEISNPVSGDSATYTLTSSAISTVGYDNITIVYGARRTKHFEDSGSVVRHLEWTSNGGTTWNTLSYTENPGDSYWHLINDSTPIALPAGAAQQDSIRFRWVVFLHSTPSGTYRIDDVTVAGTISTGINTINESSTVNLFPNPASNYALINNPSAKNYTLQLVDITGKVLKTIISSDSKTKVDLSDVNDGFYFVRINANDDSAPQVVKLSVIH